MNDMEDSSWLLPETDYAGLLLHETGTPGPSINSVEFALGNDQIRLVKITPGADDTMICCDTCIESANGNIRYTALSYAWGSDRGNHIIKLDGKEQLIPKNLWRFLKQARQLGDRFSGWLWIDALSIDQTNPLEKLHQVKIISKIFGRAEQTIVWLGPEYADSDQALQELRSGRFHRGSKTRYQKILAGPAGAAVRSLCERRYWSRLWIVQELRVAHSAEILCGDQVAPMADFAAFLQPLLPNDASARMPRLTKEIKILRKSPAARTIQLTQTPDMVVQKGQEPLDTSLWALLKATSHLQCAEARDRVYALLSVATRGHERIEPDYGRDLGELIRSVLEAKLETVHLENVGQLWEYRDELKGLFEDVMFDDLFWESLPKQVRRKFA